MRFQYKSRYLLKSCHMKEDAYGEKIGAPNNFTNFLPR